MNSSSFTSEDYAAIGRGDGYRQLLAHPAFVGHLDELRERAEYLTQRITSQPVPQPEAQLGSLIGELRALRWVLDLPTSAIEAAAQVSRET